MVEPTFRGWSASNFDRACRLSGLTNRKLCIALAEATGRDRPLAEQTLFDWRRGLGAVPFEIFVAACHLAETTPSAVLSLSPAPAAA